MPAKLEGVVYISDYSAEKNKSSEYKNFSIEGVGLSIKGRDAVIPQKDDRVEVIFSARWLKDKKKFIYICDFWRPIAGGPSVATSNGHQAETISEDEVPF